MRKNKAIFSVKKLLQLARTEAERIKEAAKLEIEQQKEKAVAAFASKWLPYLF